MIKVEEVRERRASTQGRKYRNRAWHKHRGVDKPARSGTWELERRFVGRFSVSDEKDKRREDQKEELNAKRSDLGENERKQVCEERQSAIPELENATDELEEIKYGWKWIIVDGDEQHESYKQTIVEGWPADVGPQVKKSNI